MDDVDVDYATRKYRWQTYFKGESPASAKPERIVFKAVKDKHIIGFIAGHLTNRYKDAEIQNFYVLQKDQRQGIGSDLLKNLLLWLTNHDAKSLCVGVFAENPYQAFYLKYGGKYLNPHWIFWDDLILLQEKIDKL